MITRRQPNKGDMEVQLDAIDLLAKNYYDDLRYLQKFNVYIISPKDALKLSIYATKYRFGGSVTKDNAVRVVGWLQGEINNRLENFVKADILQRVSEDVPERKLRRLKKRHDDDENTASPWKV